MPKAYSVDLRERVVCAYRGGKSAREVAIQYGVTIPCVYSWDKLEREHGCLHPLYKAGDRSVIKDDAKFLEFVKVHAHSTLKQMALAWEEEISEMSLSRKLRKLGITRKKNIWVSGT